MLVTTATILALQTSVNMIFASAFQDTETWAQKVATTLPSGSLTQTYAWMQRIPTMREWLGPRVLNNLSNFEYTLTNKDWEDTVAVDKNNIADDNLGVFTGMVIPELGRQAAFLPQQQITDLIENDTTDGFDGLPFFDQNHPLDPAGVQSNDITGNALTLANYKTSYAAMTGLKGEDGRPLQVRPTILLVPSQLQITAMEIINTSLVANPAGTAGGLSNVMIGSAEIVIGYELTSATKWYLIDGSKAIKPFIWQNRESPVLTSLTSMTDANVFSSRQFVWGVNARGAAGWSLWFLAQRNDA